MFNGASFSKDALIEHLILQGHLRTPKIIQAFRKIDRRDFVIDYLKDDAYLNLPLGIGFGQTISQPLTVAFMFELLQPESGQKILDIGSGSGWTTALLAEIVGEKGKVYGVELIKELCDFGSANANRYGFVNKRTVEFICSDASNGLVAKSPFDRILSSASGKKIPIVWKEQLAIGGRMVLPVENSLWLVVRKSISQFETTEYPGYIFVPLVSKNY